MTTANAVLENRRRVAAWFGLPLERLATAHQIHSPDVVIVDGAYAGRAPQADAMVTATPGIALGVLAADCGPVLFADAENRVIGAAHAGWKGALYRRARKHHRGDDQRSAPGAKRSSPASARRSARRITRSGRNSSSASSRTTRPTTPISRPPQQPGHAMFDLQPLTVDRLHRGGRRGRQASASAPIPTTSASSPTAARRMRRKPDYGRQISAIAIEETV